MSLKTFKTNDEAYKKFKSLCAKEGIEIGDKLNEFIQQYIKEHGDGNPQFQITQFQDEKFIACPAFFRGLDIWSEYIENRNEKELRELENQIYGLKHLIDKKMKYGSCKIATS